MRVVPEEGRLPVPDHYSRRSFLTGVLACGTLSATAAYLRPGAARRDPADHLDERAG